MKIQIMGSGCAKCKKLHDNTVAAVEATGIAAEIEKVQDMAKIVSAGVMSTPALVVDGVIKSSGKLLSSNEISALLKK